MVRGDKNDEGFTKVIGKRRRCRLRGECKKQAIWGGLGLGAVIERGEKGGRRGCAATFLPVARGSIYRGGYLMGRGAAAFKSKRPAGKVVEQQGEAP